VLSPHKFTKPLLLCGLFVLAAVWFTSSGRSQTVKPTQTKSTPTYNTEDYVGSAVVMLEAP